MKKRNLLFILFAWVALSSSVNAQGNELYGSGIKVKLNDDGSKYIRIINWNQVWATAGTYNTGTTFNGAPQSSGFDIAIRRSRVLMLAQISPRFLVLTHFGINNQNVSNFKPQIFVHDAWGEYKFSKGNQFFVGAGLSYWNGISRMTNASTLNFLAIDAPIYNWPTIDAVDQFARMMSIYAKGKLGKLDYRVAISKPFVPRTGETIASNGVPGATVSQISSSYNFNAQATAPAFQGYLNYQFWDQESNVLPFMVGSYLGSKKVFNIGAGFYYRSNGMWAKSGTDTVYTNNTVFSMDAFLDLPINKEKGTALTAYGVWYNYGFGKDYVRSIGILNPATGTNLTNGTGVYGNMMPTIGTGNTFYTQAGYLLDKSIAKGVRIQPYAALAVNTFHGLKDADGKPVTFVVPQAGVNFLMEGHHSKITLDYKNRPDFSLYNAANNFQKTYKPEITVQFMVYL